MRLVKFVPLVPQNDLVQKVIQFFRNATKILKRVLLVCSDDAWKSFPYLSLRGMVYDNFSLQIRVRIKKRFAVVFGGSPPQRCTLILYLGRISCD